MSERAPYSRLYWSLIDDPKFESIYDDNTAFAWWVRMLMIADQAHPASAHVPARLPRRVLDSLVRCGLVDEQAGGRFRIHGLDAERARRRDAATRVPSGTQTGPEPEPNRDPDGLRTTGLSQAEPSKDETSLAEDAVVAYSEVTGAVSTENARKWLDQLTSRYGAARVVKALGAAAKDDPNRKTLIGRTEARLEGRGRPRFGLQPGSPEAELAAEWAKQEKSA